MRLKMLYSPLLLVLCIHLLPGGSAQCFGDDCADDDVKFEALLDSRFRKVNAPRRVFHAVPQQQQQNVAHDPGSFEADPHVISAVEKAFHDVDALYNHSEPLIMDNTNLIDQMRIPGKFWAGYTISDKIAHERSFAALVSVQATRHLPTRYMSHGSTKGTLLDTVCPKIPYDCTGGKYRTIDGTCNNVEKPEYGANFAPMQRFVEPAYSDGVSSVRRSVDGGASLPNPRSLSNLLFDEPDRRVMQVTTLLTNWAHFIYTDMVHIGSAQLFNQEKHMPIPCCGPPEERHPECLSIEIAPEDRRYGGFITCMSYSRTAAAPKPNCELGPREQANQASSYLDGSVIYGSTAERLKALRTFRDGKLLTGSDTFSNNLPPTFESQANSIQSSLCASSEGSSCFLSGSNHVNFLPSTASLHTIWIRHHNSIANQLLAINPKWTDEQLFEEARRIVIAQMQHVTYNEFLPIVVGRESWVKYGLRPQSEGFYDHYDLNVDPTILNTWAASVGQFFFTIFEGRLAQYDVGGTRQLERPLNEYLNDPGTLFYSEKVNGVIRYLLKEPIQRPGLHMTDEFRDKLFKNHGNLGLDLAALILQTGRDHGIPSYTVWRERCGGGKITSFDELKDDLTDAHVVLPRLKKAFRSVQDVDLFILGLAEKPVRGALLGPTFGCIYSLQFQKTKRGDRFWYENPFAPSAFTDDQLSELRKTTLANIICTNTEEMGPIQPRVFQTSDIYDNYNVECNSTVIAGPNLEAWRDAAPMLELPVTTSTVDRVIKLAERQVADQRRAEADNIKRNQAEFPHGDPLLSYGQMMRAKPEALEVSKMSEVLLETTKLLMRGTKFDDGQTLPLTLDIPTLQRLLPQIDVSSFVGNFTAFLGPGGTVDKCLPKDLPCDHTTPYRSFTGWCNNLRFPHYGNAFGPLKHIIPPVYDDGIDIPRQRASNGGPLPNPRIISNAVHLDLPFDHQRYTHMVMQFGQFVDHEMTHSPIARGPNDQVLNCTRCDSQKSVSSNCIPIPIPKGDPFFPTHDDNGERRCLPFARSLLGQLTLGYRNQLNQLTSYLDGSVIYGSTKCEAAALRAFQGGRMNVTNLGEVNSEALPQGNQEQDCRSTPEFPCFVAGDERNSHQPALTVIHNMWLREHNRIARHLEILNQFWDDEKIYLETRRVIGAMLQHIIFNEYVPKLVGNEFATKYGLNPQKTGYFTGYDHNCDASISHPFATAAFRFGHTLIRRFFPRLNTFYRNHTNPVDLVDHFNNVQPVYDRERGGIDSLLLGLLGTPSMAFDRHITTAVRNHLFGQRGQPLSGMDLISINIQRARDHGVQPYNAYREFCGLPRAHDFSDLAEQMDPASIDALRSVYESVDDIDLFPGLLSERPMKGALMPPTMACLIAEQFQRLKKCDRFYYENDIAETKFSPEQLNEIRKVTLGSILCQNSKILTKIQPDVFSMPTELINAQVPCTDFPRMNLNKWMDRPICYIGNEQIPRGQSVRRSPCLSCTCTADGPRCRAITIGNCEALLERFLFTDIMQDTSCVIQCSSLIRKRAGRL
ncbi:hypothetical protein QR680_000209 [Steinernema hermaphroditum]|uniref:Peroxidase n=1 Tax=Steinernema hermaphroditum TaxID=289476 RepID=A0AA39GTT5_9BILA|nr:hypothetical protein QR680_000209 [Steinernema hermaphroditum]